MSADIDIIDAEPALPARLFHGEPKDVIRQASDTARALAAVVKKQKLTTNIQGRDHVRVEGWTLLGSMLGVFPVCEWTRRTEDGWEARVVARTMNGQTIGAAEAMCSRSERTWANRDDYALRSMAQTRATSKALRQPLGFVMTLAGFEATPAEEMPAITAPAPAPAPLPPRPKQTKMPELEQVIGELAEHDWDRDWKHTADAYARREFGTPLVALNDDQLATVIDQFTDHLATLTKASA